MVPKPKESACRTRPLQCWSIIPNSWPFSQAERTRTATSPNALVPSEISGCIEGGGSILPSHRNSCCSPAVIQITLIDYISSVPSDQPWAEISSTLGKWPPASSLFPRHSNLADCPSP